MRKFPVTVGCKYCLKNGECELQQAVQFVGLENIRYQISFKNMPVLREPFFDRNYSLCILCSRCVRACQEVRGEGVLTSNPDFHRMHWIGPESLQDSDCKFCGSCVDICPTAALYARSEKWQRPERTTETVCPYCGAADTLAEIDRVAVLVPMETVTADGQIEFTGESEVDWECQYPRDNPPEFQCRACGRECSSEAVVEAARRRGLPR
jgi:predicted molibdopterin-dependent oxidoreductase YjgC